ncbi:hypothetical protein HAX54_035156 [Datura stramonium]|uniref:Putative plant transposon protein domain-containing protein n=1 Tax=Datura stramonium TaxID=4076 RepID=A0ABS8SFA0_DATST|nr:hypothetical protein [Datura stramonium]
MTSRRTSRPRTGKQSDPTDKGKGKEKRLAEEEAKYGSDPELEEALRKAKEDEDKRAQLRHKRGKDALWFNVVPGMKERFLTGRITERYWEIFTIPPVRYFSILVREIYASYGAAQKHQKTAGPLRSRPCLEKVNVRGVEVDCSTKTINRAYFDDDDADATDYLAKLENPENHYTWITSLIAAGFVCPRLTPSKNDNEVTLVQAILIAHIMEEIHINVGDIIAMEIKDRARQAHTSLPFPVLVTNICRDTGVQEIEGIDEYI